MKCSVGIDIGGTKISYGVVDMEGNVKRNRIIKNDKSHNPLDLLRNIYRECLNWIDHEKSLEIEGIGIGAPGPLDVNKGIMVNPPNLPHWANIDLLETTRDWFPNMPIHIENDASAATVGEKFFGAGRDHRNFLYLTLSTGIGAGVFVDNKLFRGTYGNAGDIGHIVIDPSWGQCQCGQKGCFEIIASGTAISNRGSKLLGKDFTTQEIFELYFDKEPVIVELIDDIFEKIGVACVTLINIFEPEKIVFGGGVSNVGHTLLNPVNKYINKYALSKFGKRVSVESSKLKNHTGLIGAASLVFMGTKEKFYVV